MTDEAKLLNQINRGERAKRILENELFIEACQKSRADIFEELELTKWDDRERREFLDKELRALKRIVEHLKTLMITGDAASKNLRDPSKITRMIHGRR